MKSMVMSVPVKSLLLTALLSLWFAVPQASAQVDQAAEDFSPLTGVVVMPVEDEFLIDLDASQGIGKGDLFTVLRPGKKIVHPETGEVLGRLDNVEAVLEVTRLKDGYSHARPLLEGADVGRGDEIKRYANVRAAFWDYTGQGRDIFDDLEAALPQLDWMEYAAAQAERPDNYRSTTADVRPPLLFVLTDERLEARGASGQLLHAYDVDEVPEKTAKRKTETESTGIIRQEQAQTEDVWYGPRLEKQPAGIASADVDGDGANELAVLYDDRLDLLRLTGRKIEKLATLDLPSMVEGLAVDSADLDGNGRWDLYVTGTHRARLYSLQVSFSGERLAIEEEGLRWYFRTLPLPGEGEVLLAQTMGDLEHDFKGPVFRVAEEGDRLVRGKPLDLPRHLPVLGFLPFSAEGDELLYAHLSQSDNLEVIDSEGDSLWEAPEPFGGTQVAISRQDPEAPARSPEETRPTWIQMRMTRADDGSLVVPVNEGNRLMTKSRNFKRSYLAGLQWNGYALSETWRTHPLDGHLIDYRLADADNDGKEEVIMAVSFSGEGFFAKDRSTLVVVEGL